MSDTITPIILVFFVTSPWASVFGLKLFFLITLYTLSLSSGLTGFVPFITLDTVDIDTPASFAIIPACSDVKWELISGKPCSFNKLDSQINKSAPFANSTNLFLAEKEESEVYTIVLFPFWTFIE